MGDDGPVYKPFELLPALLSYQFWFILLLENVCGEDDSLGQGQVGFPVPLLLPAWRENAPSLPGLQPALAGQGEILWP